MDDSYYEPKYIVGTSGFGSDFSKKLAPPAELSRRFTSFAQNTCKEYSN